MHLGALIASLFIGAKGIYEAARAEKFRALTYFARLPRPQLPRFSSRMAVPALFSHICSPATRRPPPNSATKPLNAGCLLRFLRSGWSGIPALRCCWREPTTAACGCGRSPPETVKPSRAPRARPPPAKSFLTVSEWKSRRRWIWMYIFFIYAPQISLKYGLRKQC